MTAMTIRKYTNADIPRLKEITEICFDTVSIDQNIEMHFGLVGGKNWQWRKSRHIDADTKPEHSEGIFVCEIAGKVCGYITTRIDREASIGSIPNIAVMPIHQGKGIGSKLIVTAIEYMRDNSVECMRIETLEQNSIGKHLYPKFGFREIAHQVHYAMRL